MSASITGLGDRPLRSRLADRLPLIAGLTVLIGVIELVDLGVRLYSRTVGCRPTPTVRDDSPPARTGAPWLYPATTTSSPAVTAANVVWMPGAEA